MPQNDLTSEVLLNIFNPYETFTPKIVSAELIDLSMKSARLRTFELTREECEMLMEERMLSKITFSASFLIRSLSLKADIFWANYVVQDMGELPYSDLGFNLRLLRPEEEKDLRRVLEYCGKNAPGG